MPKGSQELTNSRKDEIISACEKLYRTMNFKDITLGDISRETSFSRPSIYNYFQTKEEIFLALMQREYDLWNADLRAVLSENDTLTADELAGEIAHSLEKRTQLLKLLSMNHYDMEEHSRPERLTEFKKSYGESLDAVRDILSKFCPEMDEESRERFIFVFFPFMFGIYPYSVATEKQLAAMKEAGVKFHKCSVYKIIYNCIRKMLGNR
ncbi:MAG: TetR family transcriptional regulator [Ruminiclostridium sp.]|nr:TetR family transcriptional regulator [Ruminiclostridium sp.]